MKLRFKYYPIMWLVPIGLAILFYMDWKVGVFFAAASLSIIILDFIIKSKREF